MTTAVFECRVAVESMLTADLLLVQGLKINQHISRTQVAVQQCSHVRLSRHTAGRAILHSLPLVSYKRNIDRGTTAFALSRVSCKWNMRSIEERRRSHSRVCLANVTCVRWRNEDVRSHSHAVLNVTCIRWRNDNVHSLSRSFTCCVVSPQVSIKEIA